MNPAHHLRREAPIHAGMIAVMAAAVVAHSALASVVAAAVFVAASVVCAALSRSREFLRAHIVDLWAMALTMLALLPGGVATGHHAVALPAATTITAVFAAWAVARAWLAVHRRREWAVSAASAGVTAVGLAAMLVLCG